MGDLLTMVINQLLNGMILQVDDSGSHVFFAALVKWSDSTWGNPLVSAAKVEAEGTLQRLEQSL